jgi:hypothetical protein
MNLMVVTNGFQVCLSGVSFEEEYTYKTGSSVSPYTYKTGSVPVNRILMYTAFLVTRLAVLCNPVLFLRCVVEQYNVHVQVNSIYTDVKSESFSWYHPEGLRQGGGRGMRMTSIG